ncbi:hypothetical protein Scep_030596 [Stephania cephalantha]|uniref:Uncharacterized protein n=1 Tax=Stephania cephalantha TaxID=152367 RepID=A0AAP0E2R5_9MAGN
MENALVPQVGHADSGRLRVERLLPILARTVLVGLAVGRPLPGEMAVGWRSFYIKRHKEMADGANVVAKFVKRNSPTESLEVGDYLRLIEQLYTRGLGFKDVVMLLFASKENVLLNLVGVHYSIFLLGVPANLVLEALQSCHISERLVCVRWWKLGRWFYGFRLRDESRCRRVSLGDLVLDKEEEVLGVLHRGTIHEVLRVQISVADGPCTLWG